MASGRPLIVERGPAQGGQVPAWNEADDMAEWVNAGGGGVPDAHAPTHEAEGDDPITNAQVPFTFDNNGDGSVTVTDDPDSPGSPVLTIDGLAVNADKIVLRANGDVIEFFDNTPLCVGVVGGVGFAFSPLGVDPLTPNGGNTTAYVAPSGESLILAPDGIGNANVNGVANFTQKTFTVSESAGGAFVGYAAGELSVGAATTENGTQVTVVTAGSLVLTDQFGSGSTGASLTVDQVMGGAHGTLTLRDTVAGVTSAVLTSDGTGLTLYDSAGANPAVLSYDNLVALLALL